MRKLFFVIAALFFIACNHRTEDAMFQQDEEIEKEGSAAGPWVTGQPAATGEMATGSKDLTVGIQAQFRRPGTFTVTFGVELIDVFDAAAIPRKTQATIEWLVAGNPITRVIDVVDGTSIQGEAEAIRLVVRDVTADGAAADLGRRYKIAVSCAPGARASYTDPPILYGKFVDLATGFQDTVPIPPRSGVRSVLVLVASSDSPPVPIAEQAVRVAQLDPGGFQVAEYDPRSFMWVPIMPGATDLFLQNDAAGNVQFTVIFAIDG